MRYTGKFNPAELGPDWKGYEQIAELCARAGMTNRQAQVTLLYTRGCDYAEIQHALQVKWKEVWRCRRRASERLEAAFPQLRTWTELVKLHDRERIEDAKVILLAARGPRRSTGRTVNVGAEDDYGRQLPAGVRAQMVTLQDMLEMQFTAMDLIPVLLEEIGGPQKVPKKVE